jgi:chromatin segregation and condensation protein Rec8/ScpA/Scc1 (kleisin family)
LFGHDSIVISGTTVQPAAGALRVKVEHDVDEEEADEAHDEADEDDEQLLIRSIEQLRSIDEQPGLVQQLPVSCVHNAS